MRGSKRSNGSELKETPKKMQNKSVKVKREMYESSPASASHSRAYSDWTVSDSLILVNEIAAMEKDCIKQLSSCQRWKLVADNCSAMEVARNSHQCHRQWDLLLAEYSTIKRYDLRSTGDSYGSMVTERRIELGLPANFDNEIFDAIGELVRAREERLLNTDSDADTETETETDTEMVHAAAKSGSIKQRMGFMPPTFNVVDKQEQEEVEEQQEESEDDDVHEGKEDDSEGEDAQKDPKEVQMDVDRKVKTRMQGKEGALAAKLRAQADLINAILKGKMSNDMDCKLSELRHTETSKLDYTRRQGDKLIACFGDLVKTLNHFSDLVQSHK